MIEKAPRFNRQQGMTLVELLIGIGIVAILAAFAAPSFSDFRDRAAIRAVGNEVQSVIDNARFEAVQRDRPVTVAFTVTNASVWCVGAREGRVACNCMNQDVTDASFCSIDRYPALDPAADPAVQGPLMVKRVTVTTDPDFGGGTSFIFDSKLGTLEDPTDFGSVAFGSPTTANPYRIRVAVTPLGNVRSCDLANSGHLVHGMEAC